MSHTLKKTKSQIIFISCNTDICFQSSQSWELGMVRNLDPKSPLMEADEAETDVISFANLLNKSQNQRDES